MSSNVEKVLLYTSESLAKLIKAEKDTVWAFILKNIYKPLFLKDKKFDIILGNPPWLSFRYVESTDYQKFLKQLIIDDYHLLDSDRAELITQLELATLFFVRSADLYLRKDGTISFVMPRSIFVSDQHYNFRKGLKKPKIGITELWDLEDLAPLFNVPSCVVTAEHGVTTYPVKAIDFKGKLLKKNSKLTEAFRHLKKIDSKFQLYELGQRSFLETPEFGKLFKAIERGQRSQYYEDFRQGATIVPHSVWFVEPVVHTRLGLDPTKPRLTTSSKAIAGAKEPYKDVVVEGEVESKFLFNLATGSEIAPFCNTSLQTTVLPLESNGSTFRIIKADEARRKGFSGLSAWLKKAEGVWKDKRGEKVEKMDIYQRLDRYRGITSQHSKTKFRVLYNKSGTYLVCCVIENKKTKLKADPVQIQLSGVCADDTTYRFDTDDYDEAMFVCGMLNAPIVDSLIKPMQSRGQWGERDIHKKVLEIPYRNSIPTTKPTSSLWN
ncbi:MAG: Eco57I restriction-modification methylase domain-containing protein [Rhabdochlamydiaceae bacterium]